MRLVKKRIPTFGGQFGKQSTLKPSKFIYRTQATHWWQMNEHYGLKVKAMGLAELVANAVVPQKAPIGAEKI